MPDCNTPEQNEVVDKARALISVYEEMADMIRLGAYRAGSDEAIDEAIRLHDGLEAFLGQGKEERSDFDDGYADLAAVLATK